MLRDYVKEAEQEKVKAKRLRPLKKKNKKRDSRIERIRTAKFQQELKNKQLSKMKKRDAQQVKLCKKIFKLASDLEKKKLIDEKKQAKKIREKRKQDKLKKLQALEQKFQNEMNLVHDKILQEKADREITRFAQTQAMAEWKKDLKEKRNSEMTKYIEQLE